MLIAPTGAGKTLAGFLPSLVELSKKPGRRSAALHTLYVSPLKALAVDVARNLDVPVAEMQLPVRVGTRTGDTSPSKRQRQRRSPRDILLMTPEQRALLIASSDASRLFATLRRIVLDELPLRATGVSCAPSRAASTAAWHSSTSKRFAGTSRPHEGSSSRWLERPIRCIRRDAPFGAPT